MPTKFRPCIDIHQGQVKQIVGGSLGSTRALQTNYVSAKSSSYYAELYKQNNLTGGHVIMLAPIVSKRPQRLFKLGPSHTGFSVNVKYSRRLIIRLDALQVGGGINLSNAQQWIDRGASKVIVTSWLFPNGEFDESRLKMLSDLIGRDRLVVDVSCRRKGNEWIAAMNKWQLLTTMKINKDNLDMLSKYCSEFLIHAADVEGLCQGIDKELVVKLGKWVTIPCTYAGGGRSLADLELVSKLSGGKVDLTIGSALDIFGGSLSFESVVAWNREFAPDALEN
ncbi:hypothetical protein SJAG_01346 [Schizosaccharomyces japonicus yFS275]|uniref:1-(5-phosphoribosyl)-5-[(5-phosphoribosylamino)methylideneamino] imidazole-4-carboxamide isomerase n=1 Tax=Schizosaccharomyces japonicus (strain yFS275 / FY16936) TaxID=402676 RepID=B6K0F2_SCHJY|nr:hypothetical protein SJAG_01346 [Schizosaccharomyces japonicus yFS275]EEB06302.2 hypothetical protein SJAG_01346 [Schizosaccharomyces japonicus yFS275]